LGLADLKQKIDLIPEYQARLDQLNREIDIARDLRDKFKEQQESSQISQALLRESKYKVIEPAKVPMSPFKPKRSQIIILGFLVGLAIGGSTALLVEILDKSFRKIEDIEEAMGLPVIGVIPMVESIKKLKLKG
jgi:capsular polysaccharide biosynthesis protein